jgi:hypothetical protein
MPRHLHALETAEQAMFFKSPGQPPQVPGILIEAGIEVVGVLVAFLFSKSRFAAPGMHVVIVVEDTSYTVRVEAVIVTVEVVVGITVVTGEVN